MIKGRPRCFWETKTALLQKGTLYADGNALYLYIVILLLQRALLLYLFLHLCQVVSTFLEGCMYGPFGVHRKFTASNWVTLQFSFDGKHPTMEECLKTVGPSETQVCPLLWGIRKLCAQFIFITKLRCFGGAQFSILLAVVHYTKQHSEWYCSQESYGCGPCYCSPYEQYSSYIVLTTTVLIIFNYY